MVECDRQLTFVFACSFAVGAEYSKTSQCGRSTCSALSNLAYLGDVSHACNLQTPILPLGNANGWSRNLVHPQVGLHMTSALFCPIMASQLMFTVAAGDGAVKHVKLASLGLARASVLQSSFKVFCGLCLALQLCRCFCLHSSLVYATPPAPARWCTAPLAASGLALHPARRPTQPWLPRAKSWKIRSWLGAFACGLLTRLCSGPSRQSRKPS